MDTQVDFSKEHRTTVIIAWAMMGSLFVYPLIVELIRTRYVPFQGFSPYGADHLKDPLLGAALLVLVAVRVVRSQILKVNPPADLRTLVNKLRISVIVTFALCEIPTILGLVLFFNGGHHKEFYFLAALSTAAMIIYFPKHHYWQAWIAKNSVRPGRSG